jgi:hypothetical protein
MKNGFCDNAIEERKALINPTTSYIALLSLPPVAPGSFSTLLRNIQFFNLVSVSVNVSINHEDEQKPDKNKNNEKEGRDYYEDTFAGKGDEMSDETALHPTSSNKESSVSGSFSTLLRNFQFLNLVSVSVNVSTNHEDERKPEKPRKNERQVPDYYRDIFGGPNDETSEKTADHRSETRNWIKEEEKAKKIPIMFTLPNTSHHDLFTVSTTTSYNEVLVRISDLINSSPNCELQSRISEGDGVPKIAEINVKWDIANEKNWPEKSKLTEENCEAVLLVMERGRAGVFEVALRGMEEVGGE